MTPTNKTAILRALKAARPLIWNGKGPSPDASETNTNPYICDAILQAFRNGDITDDEKQAAKDLINDRINHRFSLKEWLELDCGIHRSEITPARVQAHRIAWVDQLIAEFSAPAP